MTSKEFEFIFNLVTFNKAVHGTVLPSTTSDTYLDRCNLFVQFLFDFSPVKCPQIFFTIMLKKMAPLCQMKTNTAIAIRNA